MNIVRLDLVVLINFLGRYLAFSGEVVDISDAVLVKVVRVVWDCTSGRYQKQGLDSVDIVAGI